MATMAAEKGTTQYIMSAWTNTVDNRDTCRVYHTQHGDNKNGFNWPAVDIERALSPTNSTGNTQLGETMATPWMTAPSQGENTRSTPAIVSPCERNRDTATLWSPSSSHHREEEDAQINTPEADIYCSWIDEDPTQSTMLPHFERNERNRKVVDEFYAVLQKAKAIACTPTQYREGRDGHAEIETAKPCGAAKADPWEDKNADTRGAEITNPWGVVAPVRAGTETNPPGAETTSPWTVENTNPWRAEDDNPWGSEDIIFHPTTETSVTPKSQGHIGAPTWMWPRTEQSTSMDLESNVPTVWRVGTSVIHHLLEEPSELESDSGDSHTEDEENKGQSASNPFNVDLFKPEEQIARELKMTAQQYKPQHAETEREKYNQQVVEIIQKIDSIRRELMKQTNTRMLNTTKCRTPYWQRRLRDPSKSGKATRELRLHNLGEQQTKDETPKQFTTGHRRRQSEGTIAECTPQGPSRAFSKLVLEFMIRLFQMKGLESASSQSVQDIASTHNQMICAS